MADQLEFMKKVYLLKGVKVANIRQLLAKMELKKFPAGNDIIREGEKGDSLFFLFEGTVVVTKKLTLFTEYEETSEVDKALIKLKGSDYAFFGEMAMCGDTDVRSATVTADTDCELGEIPAAAIKALAQKDAQFGHLFYRNLSTVLADRLRKANRDILKLTTALTLALES